MKKEVEGMEEIYVSKEEGKRIYFYVFNGCLLASFVAVIFVCLSVIESRRREADDVEQIMKAVSAYLAEATNEEYEKIAEQIRHDLVLGKHYTEDKLEYLDYIPNTADHCLAEPEGLPYQACLLNLNTGQAYQLDIYKDGMEKSGTMISWGYDEISGTGIQITSNLNRGTGTAVLDSERGIVSVHRMKTLFCDTCIRKILEINEEVLEPELILYNGVGNEFYPIENGETYQCGEYEVRVIYNEQGKYELRIVYKGKEKILGITDAQ